MSSRRSMVTIKAKQKLGLAPGRSENPRFDQSWTTHKKLEDFAHRMRANLKNYQSAMRSAMEASKLVTQDISEFYTDPQVQSHSPGMIPIVHKFKACQLQTNMGTAKSLNFFENVLLAPLEEWCQAMDGVRARARQLEEAHTKFDHYQQKFEQLQRARQGRAEKGKTDSEKDIEKYNRNETKLFTARDEFNGHTDTLCKELTEFYQQRFDVFNPVIAKLVQFHVTRNKLWYDESEKLRPLLAAPEMSAASSKKGTETVKRWLSKFMPMGSSSSKGGDNDAATGGSDQSSNANAAASFDPPPPPADGSPSSSAGGASGATTSSASPEGKKKGFGAGMFSRRFSRTAKREQGDALPDDDNSAGAGSDAAAGNALPVAVATSASSSNNSGNDSSDGAGSNPWGSASVPVAPPAPAPAAKPNPPPVPPKVPPVPPKPRKQPATAAAQPAAAAGAASSSAVAGGGSGGGLAAPRAAPGRRGRPHAKPAAGGAAAAAGGADPFGGAASVLSFTPAPAPAPAAAAPAAATAGGGAAAAGAAGVPGFEELTARFNQLPDQLSPTPAPAPAVAAAVPAPAPAPAPAASGQWESFGSASAFDSAPAPAGGGAGAWESFGSSSAGGDDGFGGVASAGAGSGAAAADPFAGLAPAPAPVPAAAPAPAAPSFGFPAMQQPLQPMQPMQQAIQPMQPMQQPMQPQQQQPQQQAYNPFG